MSETAAEAEAVATALPPHEHVEGGVWDSIREALRGSRRDYTQGPVGRAILVLAVPMVLEMIMESVFAVCDVFFVSKLGAAAVATVGLTESWLTLIYALAMGLAIGAAAMVARRTGERDLEGAAKAGAQAIMLSLTVAVTIGVIGATLAPRMLGLMGASADVISTGSTYARIMLGGNAAMRQSSCSFSSTRSFAAPATPRSRCGCSGWRTQSTFCSDRV
jgi:Na+-driven multidrug efflux pump